jgi:hypothetical protein
MCKRNRGAVPSIIEKESEENTNLGEVASKIYKQKKVPYSKTPLT